MPLTPIRDDFNRADAGNLGANWTDLLNGLDILTNQAGAPSVADHLTFYNAVQYAADQEAYVTFNLSPSDGATAGIYVRLQGTGSIATLDGYAAILIRQAGTDIVQVYRLDNAVGTQLGANISQEFVNGDGILLRARGTTLTVIHISTGGVETVIGERTDSTYNLAGYTALACNNTQVRFDNFGGGSLLSPALKPTYYPAMAGIITR